MYCPVCPVKRGEEGAQNKCTVMIEHTPPHSFSLTFTLACIND